MNWGKYANDPLSGAVFDGSDTSMSGNGKYRPHEDRRIPADHPRIILPAAKGGDCIYNGSFVKSVN